MLGKGYGIMPNEVLFAKDLSDKQKLLFVMVSCLCAERGHCWASNKYLGEKLGFSETRVSKQLSDMAKKKYLRITVNRAEGNSRTIELEFKTIEPQNKTSGTGGQEPSGTGGQDNNISNNNINEYTPAGGFDYSIINKFTEFKKKKHHAIQFQINKQGWGKYISKQYEATDSLIKKYVTPEELVKILRYLLDYDNFWADNIQSVKKLLTKQKDTKIPLIILMKDEVAKLEPIKPAKKKEKTDVKSLYNKGVFVAPK